MAMGWFVVRITSVWTQGFPRNDKFHADNDNFVIQLCLQRKLIKRVLSPTLKPFEVPVRPLLAPIAPPPLPFRRKPPPLEPTWAEVTQERGRKEKLARLKKQREEEKQAREEQEQREREQAQRIIDEGPGLKTRKVLDAIAARREAKRQAEFNGSPPPVWLGDYTYDPVAAMFVSGGKVDGKNTALSKRRRVSLHRGDLYALDLPGCTENCNYDLHLLNHPEDERTTD